MSNEELVYAIKQGNTEYIEVLWNAVYKFIAMKANDYLDKWPEHYRQLHGDMINESYIHFINAIDGYNLGTASFLTYLDYHLKNAFINVILGGRSVRFENEPLNTAISIDQEVHGYDGDNLTIKDILVDTNAEAYLYRIEDVSFWHDVNSILRELIDGLSNETGRAIIRCMLDNNCGFKSALDYIYHDQELTASGENRKEYRKLKRIYTNSIRELRQHMRYSDIKKKLRESGIDEYIYYYNVGFMAFKNNNFTSAVELAVLRHEAANEKKRDIVSVLHIS